MLFDGGKLAGNEQMDRRFMFIKKIKIKKKRVFSAKFILGEHLQDHWSSGSYFWSKT